MPPEHNEPLVEHLEQCAHTLVDGASSIVAGEDRNVVTADDVAMTLQRVVQQQGGGSSFYDGFCGGHDGQCGIVRNATCVFSGGRGTKTKSRRRNRRKRKSSTIQVRRQGGTTYKGYCGDHLSQCHWGDLLPGSTPGQCGAGKTVRRSRKRTPKQHRQNIGGFNADARGFCGGEPSQCSWDDHLASGSSSPCTGGRRTTKSRLYRRQRQRQQQTQHSYGSSGLLVKNKLLNTSSLRKQMKNKHNVSWTADALSSVQEILKKQGNAYIHTSGEVCQ